MVQAFKKKRVRGREGERKYRELGGEAIHKQEYMSISSSYAVEKISRAEIDLTYSVYKLEVVLIYLL